MSHSEPVSPCEKSGSIHYKNVMSWLGLGHLGNAVFFLLSLQSLFTTGDPGDLDIT